MALLRTVLVRFSRGELGLPEPLSLASVLQASDRNPDDLKTRCGGHLRKDHEGLAGQSAQILVSLAEVCQDQAFCAGLPRRVCRPGSGRVVVSQRQVGMGKCCKAGIGLTRP